MATKIIEERVSDLSQKTIDDKTPTQTFAVNGQGYEIDLTADETKKFLDALGKYVDVARKTTKTGKTTRKVRTGPDAGAVRIWAASNGIEVSERGRIPQEVLEKFEAANA